MNLLKISLTGPDDTYAHIPVRSVDALVEVVDNAGNKFVDVFTHMGSAYRTTMSVESIIDTLQKPYYSFTG